MPIAQPRAHSAAAATSTAVGRAATQRGEPRIDTTYTVVTPEGVPLELRLAGPAARAVAYFIDAMIRLVVVVVISIPLELLSGYGIGFLLVLMFVLEYFYFVACEVLLDGQSPGKRVCSLRVISANGTPLTWQRSLIRNLLRPADQIPFAYGVGGVLTLLGRHFQRLGDIAASTIVVREDTTPPPPPLPYPADALTPLLKWIPNDVKAMREVQNAVDLYARRRDRLSPALRRTLAQPLVELIAERTDLPRDTEPDLLVAALHHSIWGPPRDEGPTRGRAQPPARGPRSP
ncbi:MAG: RDD family protein [Deltaproteobacteria bacterium]|nr:RDD family protein [Deltaproteobacteria bacterium]